MSGRESVGDLIPQDVAEVFAYERNTKGGRRKKRGGSLGRAFSWLKGKKKKDVNANGQSLDFHSGGQKTVKTSPQGHSQVPKQEDEEAHIPSHFQKNVFIEVNRPKYLEDLHSEAQEGLKMQQQEETSYGVDYQDDRSVTSTVTRQPDDTETETESCSYGYRRGSLSDSTMADTVSQVSTRSTVSTRSSRSGLTRQASTFRPLKSEKKPEKAKARRRHRRTTVMGIPQHIQRELGLDRASWACHQVIDEDRLPNGENENIHTIDGPHQTSSRDGLRIYMQSMEGLQPVNENQVQRFPPRAGHRDDLAVPQQMDPHQQPPSPVMSMNPQAAYMSKIIPNAVLPPSIDVVEISRSRSRSSVRTVSKSRLLLASPASSRASSRTSAMSSASRYDPPHFSDSSGWSRSDSSETLVSDSSTISSNSTARQGGSQEGDGEGSVKERALGRDGIHASVGKTSWVTATNGKGKAKGDDDKQDGPFIRSLSVMKPKRAPAPPNRSYSLHKDKMKRRSRDLADIRFVAPQSSAVQVREAKTALPSDNTNSPGYTADTSSLDESPRSVATRPFDTPQQTIKEEVTSEQPVSTDLSPQTTQENGQKKTVSPSSGYSSQGGTPTPPSKQAHNSNPGNRRGLLAKLAGIFPRTPSPAASFRPPVSGKTPEPQSPSPVNAVPPSPSVMALRELFNIPPPPKVLAPPPPPPEVWAHNKRTFELLLGPPAPINMETMVRKNPKDRRQQRQCPSASREGSVKNLSAEQDTVGVLNRVNVPEAKELTGLADQEREQFSTVGTSNPVAYTHESGKGPESQNVQERKGFIPVVKGKEGNGPAQMEMSEGVKGNSEVESERVKVSQMIGKLEKVKASHFVNGKSVTTMVSPRKSVDKVNTQMHRLTKEGRTESQVEIDTSSVASLALAHVSSSSTPHAHPIPASKQTLPVAPLLMPSDSLTTPEPRLVSPYGESSWPPPPSPLDLANIGNELDLPLPPPPSGYEDEVVITEPVSPVSEETVRAPNLAQSAPQKVSPVSQGIPPPPQTIPPPPPQKVPPSPALGVTRLTSKEATSTPNTKCPSFFIPPPPKCSPPPPPVNTIQQSKPGTTESQNKENRSPSQSSPTPPEEMHTPVVTPSLLQKVKLRSVKNCDQGQETDQTEVILRAKQPSNGEAPQKPIRRSLIMTSPPSTLTSQPTIITQPSIAPTPNLEATPNLEGTPSPAPVVAPTPAPVVAPTPAPVVAPTPAPVVAPTPAPVVAPTPAQVATQVPVVAPTPAPVVAPTPAPVVAPTPAPVVAPTPAQVATPVQVATPTPATEATPVPVVTPTPAPVVTPVSVATPTPATEATPVPVVTPTPAPVVTPVSVVTPTPATVATPAPVATPTPAPVATTTPALVVTPASKVTPTLDTITVKPQPNRISLAPKSSIVTSPTRKSPPDSATTPSMRMQEAIRLRTAARSKEGPPSRLSMPSPTSPAGLKSPTSTASFIFAKSTKKVVIETPSSPETQANLTKNLMAELSSVSNVAKSADTQNRMPPPVARKPKPKAKDVEGGETEHVQTAGQEAQPANDTEAAPNGTTVGVEVSPPPST